MRELLLVKQVPEPRAELRVLVVHHADQAVLHAEGVAVVVPNLVVRELHDPAVEVASVEDLLPVRRRRSAPVGGTRDGNSQEGKEQGECSHCWSWPSDTCSLAPP